MRTGRPKATLTVSSDERAHPLTITRSLSLPAALKLRADCAGVLARVEQRRAVHAAWRGAMSARLSATISLRRRAAEKPISSSAWSGRV